MFRWMLLLILTAALSAFSTEAPYFQQHVNYTVQAKLHHLQHRLSVKEKLVYTNHSPDTLATLYFHLYFNKFRSGAYTDKGVVRDNDDGFIQIDSLWENGFLSSRYSIDHTLMTLPLSNALAPEDSIVLDFNYLSQLPHSEGRYGFMGDHNDVGNWLVVPLVYDPRGWHLHQHIDSEFYQEWGDFDVRLTVPRGFIVGASGDLQNADSALQDTSAAVYQWRMDNLHDTTQTTQWHYIARNVTDFAWTADPEYRYYTESWQGIAVNYLVMRANYNAWKKEIGAGLGVMRLLSSLVGSYPYKQITVADTYIQAGGMEYPNIVFINTWATPHRDPAYFRGVVIHEIAHNWFFGLLASNQTEFEWQDEGFTQFAEIICMEKLYGRRANMGHRRQGWFGLFNSIERNDRDMSMYHYLRFARSGREIDPINTMPDRFRSGINIASYDKMAMVLGMLEDVMGSTYFWQGMQNYYRAWNHKHPQPEDFIRVMEKTAQRPLKWFFDAWVYQVRTLDLAVEKLTQSRAAGGYDAKVYLKNLGDIPMPFDLLAVLDNGDSLRFRVPVQPYGLHVSGIKYLSYWHFSLKEYIARFVAPAPVKKVVIDPDGLLADVDRRNNSSDVFSGLKVVFMKPQLRMPAFDRYTAELWPSFLYNDNEGIMPGVIFDGSYLNSADFFKGHIYYGTRNGRLNISLQYRTPLTFISPRLWQEIKLYSESGVRGAKLGWNIPTKEGSSIQAGLTVYDAYDINGLASAWQHGRYALLDAAYTRPLFGALLRLHGRSSLQGSATSFSRFDGALTKNFSGEENEFALNVGLRAGLGLGRLPLQEMYSLSGANGIRQYENPYYRSKGALPVSLQRDGHILDDEMVRVRGTGLIAGIPYLNAKNIMALSLDLHMPAVFEMFSIPVLDRVENSFFADIGAVWNNEIPNLDKFYRSAGVSFTIDAPYLFTKFSGLHDLRLDLPIWMDYPDRVEKKLDIRWQLHLSFAFERTPFFD